jgi:hypothetical protein
VPEILTFAWALLGRSFVIVGGALIVVLVAYWERRLHTEPHWEVYARVLLAAFAATALLAGRDVSNEYAQKGKHFSEAGPLKNLVDSWSPTRGAAPGERYSAIGEFAIDESTAERTESLVSNTAAPPTGRWSVGTSDDRVHRPQRERDVLPDEARREPDPVPESDSKAFATGSYARPELADGLRADIREVRSQRNDMPYSVELTVRVPGIVQPFGVVLTGSNIVDDLDFQVLGETMYAMVLKGHIKGRPDQYYVGFDSPAVSPLTPVVITVRAKRPIRFSKIQRAYIPHG